MAKKIYLQKQVERNSKKEPKKKQTNPSSMDHSRSLLQMEAKVDINPCQGEIDAINLNYWIQKIRSLF